MVNEKGETSPLHFFMVDIKFILARDSHDIRALYVGNGERLSLVDDVVKDIVSN